jgi:multidrug efflux pump subunit AcrA (membrane-fusion protein)
VWVVDRANMTVKQQPVRVGGAEGNDVVLAGGLSPGDTIVVAGVHVLTPGQKVRFYAERVNTASNGTVAAR